MVLKARRAGDKYEWKTLVSAAEELVEDEVSFITVTTRQSRSDRTDRPERPRHAQMLNEYAEDSPSEQARFMKHVDDKLSSLESSMAMNLDKQQAVDKAKWAEVAAMLKTMSTTATQGSENRPQRNFDSNRPYGGRGGNSGGNGISRDCYYCGGLGHFMGDCAERHAHIDAGKVKVVDGKTMMFDGKSIPREPKNKTQAVKVEEYWGRRSLNANLQTDNSASVWQYAQDDSEPEYDPRPDEIRTLKFENVALQKQLLQAQNSKPSGVQSPDDAAWQNRFAKLESFVNNCMEKTDQQFVAATRAKKATAEAQEGEDF
jgi:hypothetical protein